jgi:septal ring factor EnvC (AmiA/AmiB activator)
MAVRLLAPILTLLLGLGLGWFLQPVLNPSNELALQNELESTKRTLAQESQTAEKLRQELAQTISTRNDIERELVKTKATTTTPADPTRQPQFMEMALEGSRNMMILRLERLGKEIELTEEQALKLQQAVERVRATKTNEALTRLMVEGEQELIDSFSPAQKTAHEEFKANEKKNNAEMIANAEFSQLRRVVRLAPEQEDAVFQALADQSMAQMDPKAMAKIADRDPTKIVSKMMEAKKEALREILTPEQMEAYSKMLDNQSAMATRFLESMPPNP